MASFHPNETTEAANNTSAFFTTMVFESCQDLIDWAQKLGRSLGYIIIIKTRKIRNSGLLTKVVLMCDRGGVYKGTKISSRHTGTKKINCPFELKGKYSKLYNYWTVSVVCEKHNHEPAEHMEGHPFAMRLSDNEARLVADLTRLNVKPHDILSTLKEQNPENVSTIKTVYNARDKIKMNEKAGKTDMQLLLSFLQKGGYTYFYRANDISNEMEDLFFMHPTSIQLWNVFPYVMLMDATYKTNKYNMPLLEIVGVSSTNLTFCIAFVFMHKEKEFNYTWALNCLKSIIERCVLPQVIVTDRELALMKACKTVFPDAKCLLCRWHISESIKTKCRNSIRALNTWSFFTKCWASLVESQTEEAYTFNLAQLQTMLLGHKAVMDYLENVWLKYKHMFVSAWTDQFLNFGNHTTNRVESQHAKLKVYLDTTQSDLSTCATFIHNVVASQLTAIKASIQQSKNITKHRFNIPHFQLLWGFVSIHALDILSDALERWQPNDIICSCQLRTGYGLPCVHEQMNYMNAGIPLPLESIHIFWRKLDLSTYVSMQMDDDFNCDDEVQRFMQNFNNHSTLLREPVIQINNRGRPNLRKKTSRNNRVDKPTKEPHRQSCSSTPEVGPHSSQRHYSESYIDQFPYILHLYISHVHDVRGDGNCGFRAIASCLGFQEDDWSRIRVDLLEELEAHQTEYNDMFGSQTRFELYNALNFFRSDIRAPFQNWLLLPDMGILIAAKYNVILHSLSNAVSTTYFPLWSTPPPVHEHVAIAIGHVNGNHYVRVVLKEEYPMPPVYLQWNHFRRPCAAAWITPYIDRMHIYAQYLSSNINFSNFGDTIYV